ncbi:MAG: UPF0280 family protein [Candidatus Omnitrophica bacterium]|nr:UPF0280 family protein [Candidatus Omnitrophota bacterium]
MYKERAYRRWVKSGDLVTFEVIEKETDLFISATKGLGREAREAILRYRRDIEDYIRANAIFYSSLEPVNVKIDAPSIVKAMAEAGRKAEVGPMAAVAGAMAEFVGRDLLRSSEEIIVENGGDIFVRSSKKRTFGIYAGESSPFTGKLAVEVDPAEEGLGVCTSSGTVSHSLSFGNADAALVIARSAALADAMATAAANRVNTPADIEKAIAFVRSVEGVKGALVLMGDKMGSWGEIKLA